MGIKYTEDWDISKKKIELMAKCPYCEEETHLERCYEPVYVNKRAMFECEHCKNSFYVTLTASVQTVFFAPV